MTSRFLFQHEAYDGNGAGFPNDIALIKLAEPLELDSYRRPICLAESDDTFLGDNCFITGEVFSYRSSTELVVTECYLNLQLVVWSLGIKVYTNHVHLVAPNLRLLLAVFI